MCLHSGPVYIATGALHVCVCERKRSTIGAARVRRSCVWLTYTGLPWIYATYRNVICCIFDKLSKQNAIQRICQICCKMRNWRASYSHESADVHTSYYIIHFVELNWLNVDHLTICLCVTAMPSHTLKLVSPMVLAGYPLWRNQICMWCDWNIF